MNKQYDLGKRTYTFAAEVRKFSMNFKKNFANMDDLKQLIRSSGSVAANYIEAEEAISKKDFYHRIKICKKEAKESYLWIKLISTELIDDNLYILKSESLELAKIFGAIINKSRKV